ncbi:MAG: DUF1990 domain-containing protein [Candidatus Korobacteraceae bacterium]
MFSFSRPSDSQIRQFLARAADSEYTYSEVGATSGLLPPLFTIDHNRVVLGEGLPTWNAAVAALRQWRMFELGWVQLCYPTTSIAAGQVVGVLAHALGCYWLNACRIVYLIDEDGPVKRFGFAYGTLEDHAESGEERFLIEWNRDTDAVSYDIVAFSRPHQFLSRIGYPIARRLQKRFAAGSKAVMLRAVAEGSSTRS